MTNRWQNERKVIDDLQNVRQQLDAAKVELENVSRTGRLGEGSAHPV